MNSSSENYKEKLTQIENRLEDISSWNKGRALHPYKNDKKFASTLAQQYEEDVLWLIQQLNHQNRGTSQ